MSLKGTDGKIVCVPAADYEEFPANAVSDITGKLKYIILDEYQEDPQKVDLKDAIVFIPVTGHIHSHPAVRHFTDGIAYLAKNKPACVVVIVDTKGGVVALADECAMRFKPCAGATSSASHTSTARTRRPCPPAR